MKTSEMLAKSRDLGEVVLTAIYEWKGKQEEPINATIPVFSLLITCCALINSESPDNPLSQKLREMYILLATEWRD